MFIKSAHYYSLLAVAVTVLTTSSKVTADNTVKEGAKYSFFQEPYVCPGIIEHMVGPISDTSVNTIAYNLSKAQDSNQYSSPDYRLVHYPSGLEHIRFRLEFYDHWVRIDHPDGTAFEYQAVHRAEDGTIYLSCREHVTGSAGRFFHNLAVTLKEDTIKIYQEDGTFIDEVYQKLEYVRVLPSDFFKLENRFKKMSLSFMGYYEDKYKIDLFLEPWQQRRDGIDCYAIYYITNTETMKKGYLYIGNVNIDKEVLIDHLTIHESGHPIEINQDAPELFMRVQYSPTLIAASNENILKDIGGFFNFADIDFDGESEFIAVNNFQGQRHRDEFVVCDLQALGGDYQEGWDYGGPAALVELGRMKAPPLNYLDDYSVVDLSKKVIKVHSSGSAVDSVWEEFEWIEGAPGDGWMLTRESGASRTDDILDNKYLSFDYKYKNTMNEDGSWSSEKVVLKEEVKSAYDDES